jgi:hypothetical protein
MTDDVSLNPADYIDRAYACLVGKSRSYVDDAKLFARMVGPYAETLTNLTAVQKRDTELVEENRRLRAELAAAIDAHKALADDLKRSAGY